MSCMHGTCGKAMTTLPWWWLGDGDFFFFFFVFTKPGVAKLVENDEGRSRVDEGLKERAKKKRKNRGDIWRIEEGEKTVENETTLGFMSEHSW